ncbi:MAG: CRTAC1 family protein [Deltaproteobacteria bacterium]|nr:CRTAC1 family protein [Deltaproteobacteria bacterium]
MIGLLLGCTGEPAVVNDTSQEGISWGEEVSCEGGDDGLERFADIGSTMLPGFVLGDTTEVFGIEAPGLTPMAVGDLDGDGDPDLVLGDFGLVPTVFRNDGAFSFVAVSTVPPIDTVAPDEGTLAPLSLALADRDGDGLPELWGSGFGWAATWPNLGGGDFGPAELVIDPTHALASFYMEFSLGDVNGDGALDMGLAALGPLTGVSETLTSTFQHPPGQVAVAYDIGGSWEIAPLASAGGEFAMSAMRITDRDLDGDLDLLAPADRQYVASFWRNDGNDADGLAVLEDDGFDIGFYTRISGMGIDTADLNDDGLPDYCITDTRRPACFFSDGAGGFYEGAANLALYQASPETQNRDISGWALHFADFDNDGLPDAFQASGAPVRFGEELYMFPDQYDVLWEGRDDGSFFDVGTGNVVASVHEHYGASPVDLDGDGALELLVGGLDEPLHVYQNRCTSGRWVEIDVAGPHSGLGARVTVWAGDRVHRREIAALAGPGQAPARVHVGLGDVDTVDIEVTWPGGASAKYTSVPTRRVVTITPPAEN